MSALGILRGVAEAAPVSILTKIGQLQDVLLLHTDPLFQGLHTYVYGDATTELQCCKCVHTYIAYSCVQKILKIVLEADMYGMALKCNFSLSLRFVP